MSDSCKNFIFLSGSGGKRVPRGTRSLQLSSGVGGSVRRSQPTAKAPHSAFPVPRSPPSLGPKPQSWRLSLWAEALGGAGFLLPAFGFLSEGRVGLLQWFAGACLDFQLRASY